MSQTQTILEAFYQRLEAELGAELSIQLSQQDPATYQLEHPRGAVLLAFTQSTFAVSEASESVFQARSLEIALTLVFHQCHGQEGAIHYLDRLRNCLAGWWPPHCDQACRPLAERFIGRQQDAWQFSLNLATRATQVQTLTPPAGALLVSTTFEETL